MATLKITYTILENDITDAGIDADDYAARLETALAAKYPDADLTVNVQRRTGGIGGGADVRYVDGRFEAEDQDDADAIASNVADIATEVFQS